MYLKDKRKKHVSLYCRLRSYGLSIWLPNLKTNNDVILLDNWEAHIQAIKENGLKISGDVEETVKLPIMKPTQATEQADLIILFTKPCSCHKC